jgi:hypothetical protein
MIASCEFAGGPVRRTGAAESKLRKRGIDTVRDWDKE